jgi:hypothetical protein
MKKIFAGAAVIGAAILGATGALALDSSRMNPDGSPGGAYAAAGTHQFYVWCTGGAGDSTATMDGANAGEAQLKLHEKLKSEGKSSCWPVWQGKV